MPARKPKGTRYLSASVLTPDALQYSHFLCWPCHDLRELRALRSPISAKEVLGFVCCTELDASVLPREDPRWERLRSGGAWTVNLRERFRGALIGGAIGNAIGQGNERVVYVVTFIDC